MTQKNKKQEWHDIDIHGCKLCYKPENYPETSHMYHYIHHINTKVKTHVLKACNLLRITKSGHACIEVHPTSGQVYTRYVDPHRIAERSDRKETAQ